LLDEVAAHLDEHRRAALIEELLELDTQVFLTGTDLDLFSAFNGRAQVFKVENGELVPQ
jgi:DNA replication and repair protein RecF